MSRRYLFLTVFIAGMSTLAIEFTIGRMLQTVYGTSNIVWANVIGMVLLFLTFGYFIGGWWADKRPNFKTFYLVVVSAGISSVFFLLLTSFLLKTTTNALANIDVGVIVGSLVGVIFALFVPITLLGCVSPFAIRLAVTDVGEAGRISGRIYAVSTWGSLLGTYLPTLYTLPEFGTRLTAILFGTFLFLIGAYGLWQTSDKKSTAAVPIVLGLLLYIPSIYWATGSIKDYPNQIFETESQYNYIQVIEQGDCNYLLLNEGQAYHSFYCEDNRVPRISVWSIMLAAPYFRAEATPPDNMAVIGLAAGTIPKQYTHVFGDIPIDGIELDGDIVQAGRDYFDLNDPNINVIVGDGRYELNQLETTYDVITLDAYKVPYIPWHLTTQEFFDEVKAHLNEDGVIAVNVGRVPNDRRLVEAMTATLLTVFPSVHTVDVPASLNTILIATNQPTDSQNLANNITTLTENTHPLLRTVLETAQNGLVTTNVGENIVFTDEVAPVETIVDSLVFRYLIEEGAAGLPGLN